MLKKMIRYLKFLFYGYWKIPRGMYCYKRRGKTCPYWNKITFLHHQEDGYCTLLEKGDIDFNNDDNIILTETIVATGEVTKVSAPELPFGIGLLWDKCKECNVKTQDKYEKMLIKELKKKK